MKNKFISTTLYVNIKILEKINLAGNIKNISSNEIISILLRKMLKKYKNKFKFYHPVKYQKKDPKKQWKRHHVKFNDVDYELFTDQRKFYKLSVSLLLTQAVEEYLDELLNEERPKDNYQNCIHKITQDSQNDYIIWNIYWHKSMTIHTKL